MLKVGVYYPIQIHLDLWIKNNNILMKELIVVPYATKMTINTGKRRQGERE